MDLPRRLPRRGGITNGFPTRRGSKALTDPPWEHVVSDLTAKGHLFRSPPAVQGDAHSIFVDRQTGTMYGVADTRLSGFAAAAD